MKIEQRRETKETNISLELDFEGFGDFEIETGVGFFDHMLEALSKHSLIDFKLKATGDTHIDDHHTVEDVGIVIGQAFASGIYPAKGIERYGNATVVMDEASVSCDLDISNRPYLHFDLGDLDGKVGNFDVELVEEFFRAFVLNSRITLHLVLNRGKNRHHIIEASFKALAVALRRALSKNDKLKIPSTKGVI
jgi:imidazoleglycerol-phosphate dehydratase